MTIETRNFLYCTKNRPLKNHLFLHPFHTPETGSANGILFLVFIDPTVRAEHRLRHYGQDNLIFFIHLLTSGLGPYRRLSAGGEKAACNGSTDHVIKGARLRSASYCCIFMRDCVEKVG